MTICWSFLPCDLCQTFEVVRAVADNEEQKAILTENLVPTMVISGFVSVSIVSVLAAGIMAGWA